MYHTSIENQVFRIKKSISPKCFSQKNLQTYIASCTQREQEIAHYLLQFRNVPITKIINSTIADKVRCGIRTVVRATNKFHRDGFITKYQRDTYAINDYIFDETLKKGTIAFDYWFNHLPSETQDVYISHGIIIDHKNKKILANGTPNLSYLILDSLFKKHVPGLTHARARDDIFSKKIKKGKTMDLKQLILQYRADPRLEDVLKNTEIRSQIITPSIEKLTKLLDLDEKEQYKLVAFDDNVLKHVILQVDPVVAGTKKLPYPIRDKLQWLLSLALAFSKKNNMKPDWAWYYDLCGIVGISTTSEPKPLVIKKSTGVKHKLSPSPIPALTNERKKEELMRNIERCRMKLANPHKYVKYDVMKSSLVFFEKELQQYLRELEQIENSNEKQNISDRHKPATMAAYSS